MLKPAIVLAEAARAKMHGIMSVDALGTWQRSSVPVGELTGNIEEGFGLDGSSIRGWKSVEASGRRDLRPAFIARSRRCPGDEPEERA